LKIISFLTLAFATLRAAAELPDVVWRTNAHPNICSDVEFFPDNRSLVSASYTGSAMLWDVFNTALLRSFSIPQNHVLAIARSPDGTRVVGRGTPDGLRMWRVSDGAVLYANDPSGGPSLTFSPTDNFVARGRASGEIILSPINGESVGSGITYYDIHGSQAVNALGFSPDGSLLLSGGNDSTAKLMRINDGMVFQTFPHSFQVRSVAFAPGGKVVASGTLSGDVRLWRTNGTLLHALPTVGPTVSMDFSPDGKLLVTTSEGLLHFWRVADGASLVIYDPDPAGQVSAVDISPDGKLFAYGTGIGAVVLARMPVVITETQRVGGATIVCWQGGTGRYQLQMRTNLSAGAWQDLGSATTNLCATNVVPTNVFFRVQSLADP
jgi:WD40 repeat protein